MARISCKPPLFGPLRARRAQRLGLLFLPAFFAFASGSASAQDTPDYFRQNCLSCHSIGGGRLTGPDLKDVAKRQPDREWLIKFMMNPAPLLASSDPYAQKILEESRRVPMPALPGMTRDRAEKLLDLIDAESKLPESQFKGLQVSNAPFTPADRAAGRQIFLGLQPLKAGGAACISCHNVNGIGSLGGGLLGPDLTNIYSKYENRATLSAWLVAPGTPTMLPIFKNHPLQAEEIHSLVAYFESTAAEQPASASASRVTFLLLGLAGSVMIVFLFDSIWKRRFHAVRRPLVESLHITR